MPNSEQTACFYSQYHSPVTFNTFWRGRFLALSVCAPEDFLGPTGSEEALSHPGAGPRHGSPRCPSVP